MRWNHCGASLEIVVGSGYSGLKQNSDAVPFHRLPLLGCVGLQKYKLLLQSAALDSFCSREVLLLTGCSSEQMSPLSQNMVSIMMHQFPARKEEG